MSSFLNVPQTPRAKTKFDGNGGDSIDELPMEELNRDKTSSPFLSPPIARSLSASPVSVYGQSTCPSRGVSPAPYRPPQTWKTAIVRGSNRFWTRNRGVILVAVSQLFGALMNLAARLLEFDAGMHPFQILFVRMSSTTILSCLYMWWYKVPDFPLGPKEVRGVLILRGVSGFFGIYGMWYSMMYLPLAEATVITFLAPSVAGYICHILLKDPFTRKEQIASFIALAGVVLIARPASLFGTSDNSSGATPTATNATLPSAPHHTGSDMEPTPSQRLSAILVALLGVLGAAGAYTTIRIIGTRAHALITVTYFSVWSTVVSTAALLLAPALSIGQPAVQFAGLVPKSAYQWVLMLSLAACGFIMQFMMTAGIGGDKTKSNRATAMVYTHMLFAAGFDRFVFGHEMGIVSLVGCGLVVGAAVWAALGKKEVKRREGDMERGGRPANRGEEGVPMLSAEGGREEDADMELRRVR
ncbi:Integral membrane protein DUF6 [Madurella fahalii]|uniref:Integral membrane protein DUF6 n=1 Tax=Madurella fahalii TaxID=1157608 RepID=A0ABQ0G745_9PEZI